MSETFEENVNYKDFITSVESKNLNIDLEPYYTFDELINTFELDRSTSNEGENDNNINNDTNNNDLNQNSNTGNEVFNKINSANNSNIISNVTSPNLNPIDLKKISVYPKLSQDNNIFFCNDNFYVLIRLLFSIYERTNKVKIVK